MAQPYSKSINVMDVFSNTGRIYTQKFLDALQAWSATIAPHQEVQDSLNKHNKKQYIEYVVNSARDLLKYGEWLIALENTLENLYEVNIQLNPSILQHAEKALKAHPDHPWAKDLYRLLEQR